MRDEAPNPLDEFLCNLLKDTSGDILDYGCGDGRFIDYCSKKGVRVIGADTFKGIYETWTQNSKKIIKIKNDRVPALDKSFGAVISNQVLEHIPMELVPKVCKEITRLISNSGVGIHIFPTRQTIIEPHVGIIGAHWLRRDSTLQKFYLFVCFKLGFGYWRSEKKRGKQRSRTCKDWVTSSQNSLANHCYFVPKKVWTKAFRAEKVKVDDVSYLLLIFALPSFFRPCIEFFSRSITLKFIMNKIVHLRIGVVLKISR